MMDGVDKDFIEALLKRNHTMQEISDLLRKRNPNVRGFSLRSVQRFCQDQDHDLSSREITNGELKHIVRQAVGLLLIYLELTMKDMILLIYFLVNCETLLLTYLIKIR